VRKRDSEAQQVALPPSGAFFPRFHIAAFRLVEMLIVCEEEMGGSETLEMAAFQP